VFVTNVGEFRDHFPGRTGDQGVTREKALGIKKIEPGVPAFCQWQGQRSEFCQGL